MTALALLEQVAAAGVQIRVVGADLAIRPKGVLPPNLRTKLAANKSQVRTLLDPEVRWRVEVMYPQVPVWPAPVLSLLARPDIDPHPSPLPAGEGARIGLRRTPDDFWGERGRARGSRFSWFPSAAPGDPVAQQGHKWFGLPGATKRL